MRDDRICKQVIQEAAAGCAFTLILTLVIFAATAGAMTVWGFSEAYLMPVLFAGTLLAVFAGAMVSCPYSPARGAVHGLWVGLLYGCFMLLVGAVTVAGFALYGGLVIRLLSALGAGILGGISGRLRPLRR